MSKTEWKHPTGNTPKIVALVCLGPSRNSYIGGCFENDLSDAVCGVDEVWTLNRGVSVFHHDLLFVMDHIQGEADKFPRYGATLWKHNKPIITSDDCAGWPNHVHKYPFREIWNWTIGALNPMHGDLYHNSVAYILTYAGYIGVKELRIFGADYSMHSSGVVEDGHPNVAYWVGKLESIGLHVFAPTESSFLNINQRGWIYGYQNDPRRIPANRARFRAMVGGEPDPDSTALLSGERQVSPAIEGIQADHVYRYKWAAEKIKGEEVVDLACGCGYGSAILFDAGATHVVGVDLSAESIDYAKKHHARDGIVFYADDLEKGFNKPEDYSAFDNATAFEIIEHLADPKPLLKTLPARRLFASVPNQTVIPYSPETAPFHQRHYTPHQLQELLRETGWQITHWRGQQNPQSKVTYLTPDSRTIIVEAVRY